ncbi:MAG: beta-phosphoglucomutase, partial [Anaerolineales bacterium]
MAADMGWALHEERVDRCRLNSQETLFSIGNGYLGTRGVFEEGFPGEQRATLLHGVFDDAEVGFTELVNAPDWLNLEVFFEGARFSLDQGEPEAYRRSLNLKTGLLSRLVRWRTPAGRRAELLFERFASLAQPHLVVARLSVRCADPVDRIEVRAGLEGKVDTLGRAHLEDLDQGVQADVAWLASRTRQSGIGIGLAARLEVEGAEAVDWSAWDARHQPTIVVSFPGGPGWVRVTKVAAYRTSREGEDPARQARLDLSSIARPAWDSLWPAHQDAWEGEWRACDVEIEGDPDMQRAIRFNLYHLLIAAPRLEERATIGAKTLSGFGYRGHAFWDTETFMLPFFNLTRPALARNLLSYRWHTLPAARRKAEQAGYRGAWYAWESAATGDEVTPVWLPDPNDPRRLVRIWTGDLQIHITADVAHAVWGYWRATGDDEFLRERGAEILVETARFWSSRAAWEESLGGYSFRDVMGPDEYHDHVDHNAYTNAMARWNLQAAQAALEWLRAHAPDRGAGLAGRLRLQEAEPVTWRRQAEKMYLPMHPATRRIEQFAGYYDRREVDLAAYEPRRQSMQVLLEIEGANQSQVIKQPDVLMMFLLLGDEFDRETVEANYTYYTRRTDLAHGSSLGPAIHAVLAARLGRVDEAYQHFRRAAEIDLLDLRGNTRDGIHGAAAGGVWQALAFGFAGLRIGPEGWTLEPRLPPPWARMALRFRHHGRAQSVELDRRSPAGRPKAAPPIRAFVFDLDGVLTDTAERHYLAWKKLADDEGIPFTREENEALRGVSRRESLRRLLKGRTVSEVEAQALMARKNAHYVASIRQVTPSDLLPGVAGLLREIRQAGMAIAVASSSRNAGQVIEALGLQTWIDVLCDGSSGEQSKPAPDLFLEAARRLGVPPTECVAVEDAAAGIEASRRAGMRTLGVGPAARVGEADLVLP